VTHALETKLADKGLNARAVYYETIGAWFVSIDAKPTTENLRTAASAAADCNIASAPAADGWWFLFPTSHRIWRFFDLATGMRSIQDFSDTAAARRWVGGGNGITWKTTKQRRKR